MAGMKLVVSGPTESKAVRLDAKGVTLGRGSNCDIVLDHTNVSRVHARISQDPFVVRLARLFENCVVRKVSSWLKVKRCRIMFICF